MFFTEQTNIITKINIIERELKNLKETLNLKMRKESNSGSILELYGCWEGEIDSFLNELYSRRKRKGRLTDEKLSI